MVKPSDRDMDEIALEVAEKAINEWGKSEGELLYLKRAPKPLYDKWKKTGVLPRNIDREIVEIMHRTHIGVDQDYKNLMKQGTRAAIADGWGGSMLATDLQDVLFGTPYPVQSEANLGVMKADHVNLVIHGHEPVLSEMIVAVAQKPEMHEYATIQRGQGHPAVRDLLHGQRSLQRHGVPLCGTFCSRNWPSLRAPATPWWSTSSASFRMLPMSPTASTPKLSPPTPSPAWSRRTSSISSSMNTTRMEDAERIVKMAIDNFENRGADVMIPKQKGMPGRRIRGRVDTVSFGRSFRGELLHPERQHHQRPHPRHRRCGGLQQCPRTRHNEGHIRW
jgi:carbon-monoxide dehydrogenase catalytic subunit